MSNIKQYVTNWKFFVPVLVAALVVGVTVYNSDNTENTTASNQEITPAGEADVVKQEDNVEVEVEAAVHDETTETKSESANTTSEDNAE